jgi:hypothetical protein
MLKELVLRNAATAVLTNPPRRAETLRGSGPGTPDAFGAQRSTPQYLLLHSEEACATMFPFLMWPAT